MSKAEALYQLIDDALPETKVAAPNAEAQAARALAARSAQALESVAAALAPLESLMGGSGLPERWDARSSGEARGPANERPAPSAAPLRPATLTARAWIDAALARLGAGASRLELNMKCVAVEFNGGAPRLVFEVSRIGVDGKAHYRGHSNLPLLALSAHRRIGEPEIGVGALAGGVSLDASAAGKEWICALLKSAEPHSTALMRFHC
ncbi:hypothetical protein MW290_28150 [Aquincola tertiaricarbonis]|uniref:SCP2 domain-containing protein n=1 Tax=Aquincola tertiaricarbonis TaxID=391953 RepID=A0ABY4S8Z3_AQUTE|nr:hypothetical protein [Aquincola tertiaricarbonis]URI09439.1 hypothetical protein MW290_28150 [Aquincola tertiaricarbonis]